MSTPMHCPGLEAHKNLSSVNIKCPGCGKITEIFSDEFDRTHVCKGCKEQIDFAKATVEPS